MWIWLEGEIMPSEGVQLWQCVVCQGQYLHKEVNRFTHVHGKAHEKVCRDLGLSREESQAVVVPIEVDVSTGAVQQRVEAA